MLVVTASVDVEHHASTIIECHVSCGYTADAAYSLTSYVQRSPIFHHECAREVAAVAVQGSEAIHPNPAALQRTVEVHCSAPDIGLAREGMVHLCHVQRTVSLFDESHRTRQCASGEVARVTYGIHVGIAHDITVGSLYPYWHIDGEDIR